MKKIKLTQSKFALVDDDFEWLNQWKWKFDSTTGYACRTLYPKGKVYMHTLINETIGDLQTDHINRDKLDNRQSNLRTVTSTENSRNTEISVINTSGYKGVSFNKGRSLWEAYIHNNYKKINLGLFKDIDKAILARQRAESIYWI